MYLNAQGILQNLRGNYKKGPQRKLEAFRVPKNFSLSNPSEAWPVRVALLPEYHLSEIQS